MSNHSAILRRRWSRVLLCSLAMTAVLAVAAHFYQARRIHTARTQALYGRWIEGEDPQRYIWILGPRGHVWYERDGCFREWGEPAGSWSVGGEYIYVEWNGRQNSFWLAFRDWFSTPMKKLKIANLGEDKVVMQDLLGSPRVWHREASQETDPFIRSSNHRAH